MPPPCRESSSSGPSMHSRWRVGGWAPPADWRVRLALRLGGVDRSQLLLMQSAPMSIPPITGWVTRQPMRAEKNSRHDRRRVGRERRDFLLELHGQPPVGLRTSRP